MLRAAIQIAQAQLVLLEQSSATDAPLSSINGPICCSAMLQTMLRPPCALVNRGHDPSMCH